MLAISQKNMIVTHFLKSTLHDNDFVIFSLYANLGVSSCWSRRTALKASLSKAAGV